LKRSSQRWVILAAVVLIVFLVTSTTVYPVFSKSENQPAKAASLAAVIPPTVATPTPPVPERPGQAILNPGGIGLAVLFVFLMVNLFRWMFKVPPHLPYEVVKARQSVSALHRILVPTTEGIASERAVELACRLGEAQKAEIIITNVVEVPFTLSLDTPLPEQEKLAQEALRTARFIVEQHGLPVQTKIIPHRYAWGGILRLAREEMVDAIVMSVGAGRPGLAERMGRTAQEVLRRAECEVVLDKVPG
jgi:nucleotide-binding universal stress UspA family protein